MKKLLLTAFCAVAAVMANAGEFTYKYTFVKNAIPNNGDVVTAGTEANLGGMAWTSTALGYVGWDTQYEKGLQIGKSKAPEKTWTLSTDAFKNADATVTKVVLELATASGCTATAAVKVGETALTTTSDEVSRDKTAFTFTGSATGALAITLTNGEGGKAMYIASIAVTYTAENEIAVEKPVTPEVATLSEWIEEQPKVNTIITGDVTVIYQSSDKKYTYITDGTETIQVYAASPLANTYANGDKLTGICGKYDVYNNCPQMVPDATTFGEAAKGEAVAPVLTTLGAVAVSQYVKVEGVTITSETKTETDKDGKEKEVTTITATQGDASRVVYNRFKLESIPEGANYTIVGFGSVFGETQQIFPVTITPTEGSAISEVNAAAGAAANAVYDLQGRRLAAPVKGINIINGRKVLVK